MHHIQTSTSYEELLPDLHIYLSKYLNNYFIEVRRNEKNLQFKMVTNVPQDRIVVFLLGKWWEKFLNFGYVYS